jgi:hypothetical protein
MTRLNARAAQYGGRILQARRRRNRATPPCRQPARAGETASEKPDSTRKKTTARRPYNSQPSQKGPELPGNSGKVSSRQ